MIRFEQVSKKYPGSTALALNSLDIEILRGEFVFLVGASGSGKSTFLRLILKEEKPSKGQIRVLGQDLNLLSMRKVPYFRRNIGVVFQDFRLLSNKTVFENVAFTLQVIGKSRGFISEAVPDVLTMVGLDGKDGRFSHELSGGEQQRVAIARAVVNKPQILLADEPTGNLDPATSADIMAVLERINADGTTIIMATHEASIVDKMKRRVLEVSRGQLIRDERGGGYVPTQAISLPKLPPVGASRGNSSVYGDSDLGTRRSSHMPIQVSEEPVQSIQMLGVPVDPILRDDDSSVHIGTIPTQMPAHTETVPAHTGTIPTRVPEQNPAQTGATPTTQAQPFAAQPQEASLDQAPLPQTSPKVNSQNNQDSQNELPKDLDFTAGLKLPKRDDSSDGDQKVGPTQ